GVLRMLERFLGPEAFREGIRRYLNAHLYDNAETTDLWDAIEEATGEPVRATMDSWICQEGHALVTVETTADGVSLSQSRFTYSGTPGTPARWSVPVLLRVGSGGAVSEHRVLLQEQSTLLRLDGPPDWVVANAGGSGFYRVHYGAALAETLRSDL